MRKKPELIVALLMATFAAASCGGQIDDATVTTNDSNGEVSAIQSELNARTARRKSKTTVCAQADEGEAVTLICPAGQVITSVTFASYGTPTGACGAFQTSACHAPSTPTI